MNSGQKKQLILLSALLILLGAVVSNLRELQSWWQDSPAPPSAVPPLPRLAADLRKIAEGFSQITDLQAVPSPLPDSWLVVVEKTGAAHLLDTATGKCAVLLEKTVATSSEQGLLGLAFDPNFAENRTFYTNSVVTLADQDFTSIDQWRFAGNAFGGEKATEVRTILRIAQPYPNHNGGQLAFGPDGYLYIGTGDGGSGGDPHGHGQNPLSLLGKMLRIDPHLRADLPVEVTPSTANAGYRIPVDNPFVGRPGHAPELWALGLRNPWRYSFDKTGQLWVADVGQHEWEEIDVVRPADNLGWNVREGAQCFEPKTGCKTAGLVEPVWQGRHPRHVSITGGFVYAGSAIPALQGKYVFGDFGVPALFAIDAAQASTTAQRPLYLVAEHKLMVSTLGLRRDGELYIGDFNGSIWLLVAADSPR